MIQRWSSLDAPRAGQFERWRELICEAFLALTPESELRDGFAGTVAQRRLAELSIAQIDSQRQRVQRAAYDIEQSPQRGFYANLQIRGTSLMEQHGRTTVLRPGDIAVVDTSEPFTFDFWDDFRQLSFYVPGQLLGGQLEAPVPTATRLATTAGAGAAARHALLALTGDGLSDATAARLAVNAAGLLAVTLEQGSVPPPVPHRHDRLHAAALNDIEEHLADHDLSAAATARRLGVSVRQLYAVFAARPRSYAEEVRRRRLDGAWRDLREPTRSHLRIIDVAVEAGFVNVASFHRAFRREYGRTPAEVRRLSLGPAVDLRT